jgi:hypothetical protein
MATDGVDEFWWEVHASFVDVMSYVVELLLSLREQSCTPVVVGAREKWASCRKLQRRKEEVEEVDGKGMRVA